MTNENLPIPSPRKQTVRDPPYRGDYPGGGEPGEDHPVWEPCKRYTRGTPIPAKKDGIIHEYISDYDFLVVTKNNPEKTYVQESKIMDRVDHFNPPVNLEIHEIDYINEGLGWGQYFFADIVKEGILLYDGGNVNFIEPRILTPAEEKEKAQRYFNLWFPISSGFLDGVRYYLSKGELKIGAFNLHQAAESLYYSLLLVFTGYKPKTHNLWKLRKKTKAYSDELFLVFKAETDKQEEHLFDLLKRGYVEARYKQDHYSITKDELSELISRVELMASIVQRICGNKIDSL